ncbi:MAG: CotH kinase family protein [Flavobacteriales bacterium]|nr:CotH kinase family protein [Flavobacteriales bacterium]
MRIHTVPEVGHGVLPVLSLVAPDGAFFDPDSGLLVVGHTMLNAPLELERSYARDPRFWKYPGNFHGRGKDWERRAVLQCLGADGGEEWQVKAGVRINGQMTRGFPQHALRVLLDEPLQAAPWGEGSAGATSFVIRAAGNDQVKAMMRDAYQHGLCDGLLFEVSKAMPCVLYMNGAYWGVHHLRQRMDDEELARRYNVKAKKITIVEDLGVLYKGDPKAPDQLLGLVDSVEQWDGRAQEVWQHIEAQLDVPEFLQYMAVQLVLGNMDWPRQNVKYWRYEGKPIVGTKLDGRWHMIMGDSDLGFGAVAPPGGDMFQKLRPKDSPTARLFMGLMRSPDMLAQFKVIVEDLVSGPLSSSRLTTTLDHMTGTMAPEMERHTARWRKPVDAAHWQREVQVMREFAVQRPGAVRAQVQEFTGQ